MSFLSIDECLACAWNATGDLRMVRVKKAADRFELLDFAASSVDGDESVARSLSTLTQQMSTPTTHLIVAAGEFSGAVCFDILMPQMPISDIKQALSYELPRYLPVSYSNMVIGYRLVTFDSETDNSDKLCIRVFAIDVTQWNEFLADLTNFGVRFDYFFSPYFAVDPLLSDKKDVFFSFFDFRERFVKDVDNSMRRMSIVSSCEKELDDSDKDSIDESLEIIREMGYDSDQVLELLGAEEFESYIPALLSAVFALGPEFQENRNFFPTLPRQLKPERFRKLRLLSIVLMVVMSLLAGSIVSINLWEKISQTNSLRDELAAIQKRTMVLKREIVSMEPMENDLIDKLTTTDVGIGNMSQVMHKLCLVIPKRVWLLHFSSRDSKIDLSARAPAGSQSSLMTALNRSGVFKTKSSYTRRNSDGTENIYIHMLMNSAPKPKGEK